MTRGAVLAHGFRRPLLPPRLCAQRLLNKQRALAGDESWQGRLILPLVYACYTLEVTLDKAEGTPGHSWVLGQFVDPVLFPVDLHDVLRGRIVDAETARDGLDAGAAFLEGEKKLLALV